MAWTGVSVKTSTPWASSSAWTRAPSSGSTVGSTSGSCFDLGDLQAAGGQGFGHLQADVAGADDDRGRGVAAAQGCA